MFTAMSMVWLVAGVFIGVFISVVYCAFHEDRITREIREARMKKELVEANLYLARKQKEFAELTGKDVQPEPAKPDDHASAADWSSRTVRITQTDRYGNTTVKTRNYDELTDAERAQFDEMMRKFNQTMANFDKTMRGAFA